MNLSRKKNVAVEQLNDFSVIKSLEANLLDELRTSYEREQTVSDDLLESLHFIYQTPLFEALNQIDKYFSGIESSTNHGAVITTCLGKKQNQQQHNHAATTTLGPLVTAVKCNDRMSNGAVRPHVYQVKGSMDVNYYLFDELTFCACSSFKFNVLGRGQYLYCKHIVMVKLMVAMRRVDQKIVSDADMSELIRQIQ